MVAFGDLDYRILGPLKLAWSQKRLPARLEIRCLPHLANAGPPSWPNAVR